jgi:hypothetical protein
MLLRVNIVGPQNSPESLNESYIHNQCDILKEPTYSPLGPQVPWASEQLTRYPSQCHQISRVLE